MQRANLLRLILSLVLFAAAACGQVARYSIEQRTAGGPGVLCWKDSAGAELCLSIPTGALASGAQTWKLPVTDPGGGGCWTTDGSYNVTVGACAGGGGSSGAANQIQLSDGSGGFTNLFDFRHDGQQLVLPVQASAPTTDGAQVSFIGDTTTNVNYVLQQQTGDFFLSASDGSGSNRTLSLLNSGAGALHLKLESGASFQYDISGTGIPALSLDASNLSLGLLFGGAGTRDTRIVAGGAAGSNIQLLLDWDNASEGYLRPTGGTRILLGSPSQPFDDASIQGTVTINRSAVTGSSLFRIEDLNGTNHFLTLRAASTMAADYTLAFPAAAPATGQILRDSGSGLLAWRADPPYLASPNTWTQTNTFNNVVTIDPTAGGRLKVGSGLAFDGNYALAVKPLSFLHSGIIIESHTSQSGPLLEVMGQSGHVQVLGSGGLVTDVSASFQGGLSTFSGSSSTVYIGASGAFHGHDTGAASTALSCAGKADGWQAITSDNYIVWCDGSTRYRAAGATF